MSYINPFLLFRPYIDKSRSTEEQFPLLRKKILAEISLSTDGFIIAQGQSLTKDDLLKYFEDLKKPNYLHYYELIANDVELHAFLSGAHPVQFEKFSSTTEYLDEEFIRFISPMFKEYYVNYITQIFRVQEPLQLAAFMDQKFLTKADKVEVFSAIINFLERQINKISAYKFKIEIGTFDRNDRNDLRQLTTETYVAKLNRLPADFDHLRDSYASQANNIAASLQTKERNEARRIFGNIVAIKCNPELTSLLKKNDELINGKKSEVPQTKAPSGNSLNTIITVIVIVLVSVFWNYSNKSNDHGILSITNGTTEYPPYGNSEGASGSSNGNGEGSEGSGGSKILLDIRTNDMLNDLMIDYENYHANHSNINTKAKSKSISVLLETLQDLQSDSLVLEKYHYGNIVSYTERKISISNNTSYDLMLFYTLGNYISVLSIPSNTTMENVFWNTSHFRFYLGKNFDENRNFNFMGRKINGAFRVFDNNSKNLLNEKYLNHSMQSLRFYEQDGVVHFN